MKSNGRPMVPDEHKRSIHGRINATVDPAVKRALAAVAGSSISRWLEAAIIEKMRRDRKKTRPGL